MTCIIVEDFLRNYSTERTGGVVISLYTNNVTGIIILVNETLVKRSVISETALQP